MNRIWRIMTSLRLTVILLSFSMALIFFGTLDQVHFGIYEVQKRYFESFLVLWSYPKQWLGGSALHWLMIPLPGGYLLAILLLANLVCAHFKYFVAKWNKVGIVLIHVGVLVLIISGVATSFFQQESQMWLTSDEPVNYSKSTLENEFVIIDNTDTSKPKTYHVDEEDLKKHKASKLAGSPFSLKLEKFYPNSDLGLRSANPEVKEKSLATHGAGVKMDIVVFPKPVSYRQDETNIATAYVTVIADDEVIGTWLISTMIDNRFPPQKFTYDDKDYEIALRFKRTYFPFSLKLLEFKHDKYPGTEIPRNFSSLVQINDPANDTDRSVLIYMNNPLRYEGYTFYQASYGEEDGTSILQVVRNPGWVLPYCAVLLIGIGLLVHFIMHLLKYLKRRSEI